MHVGFVVYGPLDRRSGGFLYDRTVVDYLRRQGDDVDVFSLPERRYVRSTATNLAPRLPRRLERCDVVVEDELCHPSLPLVNLRIDGAPVVSVVHHPKSAERRGRWRNVLVKQLEAGYLRTVDGFVFNSDATRDAVGELVDPQPSVVAPPGGDRFGDPITDRRIRRRSREDPLRVVAVGSVTPRKEITTLVRGLARVSGDWDLVVVGDTKTAPDYVAEVRRLAAVLDVEGRVRLTGRLSDDELSDVLAASHVFALPSRHEGFGIAYLEGMAFGLPAIASRSGGAGEIVAHGENGYLVPPGDPAAVAEAIAPLCTDRDRLGRLSEAALSRYREHPGWETTGERVRRFLQRIAT